MTCHQIFNRNNITGVTRAAGTFDTSAAMEFTPGF